MVFAILRDSRQSANVCTLYDSLSLQKLLNRRKEYEFIHKRLSFCLVETLAVLLVHLGRGQGQIYFYSTLRTNDTQKHIKAIRRTNNMRSPEFNSN